MHLNPLVGRDAPCPQLASCAPVSCAGQCSKTESCSIVAQSCPSTCAKIRCDPIQGGSSKSSGPSPGALAGAVIGALLFLALVVLGYLYYRKREAAKEASAREMASADVKPDIPARADAVLSRPDPHLGSRRVNKNNNNNEKPLAMNRAGSGDATELGTVRVYNNPSDTTINLDPSQQSRRYSGSHSARSNPFADGASIQTASDRTQSTNVIPIALVPPGGHSPDPQSQGRTGSPSRPARSPDLSLRDNNPLDLEHVAVSDSEMDNPHLPYAASSRSGVSGTSFLSASSEDLDEAPMIMTPKQGVVRQVFGVSQAQVVQVPPTPGTLVNTPVSSNLPSRAGGARSSFTPKGAARASKTVGRSPLAQQPFTPKDIPLSHREPVSPTSTTTTRGDPFADAASPNRRASFADSSRSTDTFGSPTEYHSEGPFTPRPGATFADAQNSRPVSTATTTDGLSIRADIGTASRVILDMQSPSAFSGPGLFRGDSQSRATSMQTSGGRTIMSVDRDDDEESVRRHSLVSAKTTSSRADSILAAFPFVPPSPISALPPRSPGSPGNSPASTGSTFARQQQLNLSSTTARSPPASPRSPVPPAATRSIARPSPPPRAPIPPVPPVLKLTKARDGERGESIFSTSTASGLETYPFQFGGPTNMTENGASSRASLDTLALSRDLAAFPIEYERSSVAESQKSMK